MCAALAEKVIQANIAVHSKLAEHYNSCEPHFRPENVAKVESRLCSLAKEIRAKSLLDLGPTFRTASHALSPGGKFYADLDPNFYFWEAIYKLDRGGDYHPLVKREIEAVAFKDEEIEAKFGVSREVFNHAEFGKDIAGGFKEETLREGLLEAGFTSVEFHYHWFLGEGFLINSGAENREELFRRATVVNEALQRA